jgi:phosphopantothenoylcysteine decarboxylase/phosphopantothenate--cysteine ligase
MKRNILLVVSGSVAAFKAAALASKLTQAGFEVRTVLTAGAKAFVGAPTFEGLTRGRVYDDTFATGDAMAHIDLTRWADLTLVYPASGNTLTKLASGRADDLLGTLFLAHDFKRPYWIVPAMNPSMLAHPAVVEAVAKLRAWGLRVLDSDEGRMACGEVGSGRLVEPETMLTEIESYFGARSANSGKKKEVLVTAGGTSETIDPVRVLTNVSTGETGVRVANSLHAAGNAVTLLLAESSSFADEVADGIRLLRFRTFDELDGLLRKELGTGKFATLVHAAAVSDYHVERIETSSGRELSGTVKIQSKESLVLKLAPNPKILERVRDYAANPDLRVISFKLATRTSGENGDDLVGYESDWIVHNTVAGVERGTDRHAGEIYEKTPDGYRVRSTFRTKADLTRALNQVVNV